MLSKVIVFTLCVQVMLFCKQQLVRTLIHKNTLRTAHLLTNLLLILSSLETVIREHKTVLNGHLKCILFTERLKIPRFEIILP